MASRNSSNSFQIQENENHSEKVAEKQISLSQEGVLSEAAQKHMQLIGTFLVQIIQEWNERHLPGSISPESSTSSDQQ